MKNSRKIKFHSLNSVEWYWYTGLASDKLIILLTFPLTNVYRQNRLRFIYTHFKSCDQSLDKTSFDFSNLFRAIQSCAMNAKSSIILKFPKSMVT